MSCIYCDDTGQVNNTHCPCPAGDKYRKAMVVASKDDMGPAYDQNKVDDIVSYVEKRAIDFKTKNKNGIFDLLRYRFKQNGMMLFIYGPKDNEDKVIQRLKEVIAKYEAKQGKRQKYEEPSFWSSLKLLK